MNISTSTTAYLREFMMQWRHDFHAHPELGSKEHRTSRAIVDLLRKVNMKVFPGIGGTGVVGVLKRGNSSRSIGLRADMDAIEIREANNFDYCSRHEGKMHACGHDGHMAMLLGAAHHLAKSDSFDGIVYFIFQPCEEAGQGAKAMMSDGLFERFPADNIYAIHNMPSLPVGNFAVRSGPVMACEDHFEILIEGKGTHAALPHLGVDPIVVGSEIVMALQSIVSRALNPVENAVVSVTEFITDGVRNVLPTKIILRGDTRSFDTVVQKEIETSMARIVHGISSAHGATSKFTYSHEFVATINTSNEAYIAADVARKVVGEKNVYSDCPPFMTSEDFGFMLAAKPGCFLFLGNGSEGPGGCGLHNPGYDFNDDNLTIGADFWVHLVEAQLSKNS
ncbi:MAG: amidohydrolase [Desulfuromonadales bacterium]|nr:amidohydrolase [Desulfuromonadales bacterium]